MRSVRMSVVLGLLALGLLGLMPGDAGAWFYYPAYSYYPVYPAYYYPAAYYYPPAYYYPTYTYPVAYTYPATYTYPVTYAYPSATAAASAVALAATPTGWTSLYYTPAVAPPRSTPPAGSVVDVTVGDDYFQPLGMTVTRGTVVRWTNRGSLEHTVSSANGRWNAVTLAPGESTTIEFVTPGTYHYECRFHPEMRGTITVK